MTDDTHFDALETRDPAEREAALFDGFGTRLARAIDGLPGLAAHLAGHALESVTSRADLATLPVLRKDALMAAQRADPPFGGFVDVSRCGGTRAFMSPGPVFEVQLPGSDPWASARALHAAGFRPGMTVHNAFSYHQTPGGFILDEGARALGCTVFPAGVGNGAMQVEAIRQLRPAGWTGTPDYLATLLDHAAEEGEAGGGALDSIRVALVSGGALFPTLRERYRAAGIAVLQCYATADAGVIAHETAAADGAAHPGMLVSEGLIVEICQPGSGQPVAAGERGEVVVTRLGTGDGASGEARASAAPLVRFATGDLSAFLDEPSPCGRTNARLAGWLGRADQRTKVRGMFVDPVQVQRVRAAHPELERVRLVVERAGEGGGAGDVMTLRATRGAAGDAPDLVTALEASLKRECGLGGRVELVDSLPADGIVVEDRRDYEAG